MLSQLSYWPWLIGGAVSFIAAFATTTRTIGEQRFDPGKAVFSTGVPTVIFCALIEASNTGVFVDRGIADILDGILGLALTGGLSCLIGGAAGMALKQRSFKKTRHNGLS